MIDKYMFKSSFSWHNFPKEPFLQLSHLLQGTYQYWRNIAGVPSSLSFNSVRLNNIFTLCLPCQKWNYNFSHEDFIVYFPKSSHHNLLLQWGYDRGWSWPTKFTRPVILHFCTENSRRKVKRNWKSLKTANLI